MESSPSKRISHHILSSRNLEDLVRIDQRNLNSLSKRLDPPIRRIRGIRPIEAVHKKLIIRVELYWLQIHIPA
jgi:hypothetical protein